MKITEIISEAFDQPYNIRWSQGDHGDYDAYAELDDGTGLEIAFLDQQHNSWMVDFFRDNSTEITGEGDAYRVFATVLTAMREFIVKQQPAKLNFSAEKNDDPTGSRASLYDRMIQRYITGTGYTLTRQDHPDGATYTLTKQVQGVEEDAQLPGDFKLMGQNLFLKNLARNLKQRYPDATVKLSSDRVTAYHNEGDDEALTVMGTEVMDSGYIGVGLDDAFTESFQGVLVPTIKQTTEQLLAANPGTKPALFLSTDNWNPDAWTHIATKLGYRLVADDESLDEQDVAEDQINELGNAPADYKANRKRKNSLFHATVEGHWVDVFFDRSEFNGTLHITFTVNGDYDAPSQPTSASKSTVKILSTVLNVIKQKLPEYIKKSRPPAISFTSKQDNRTNLYRKYFVPVIQDILGPKWQHEEYPSMGMTVFHWKPVKKQDVTESNLNEAPAGGYRLVRVVDGLDNIQANTDGSLTAIARFNGHSQRNTLHFTVNSMVGDHNMGKFPGKYVIIANPAEMPRDQAAGARAEDTWYRFNNEGEINLGRAIVLAPEGSSVPNGIRAEYYKGDRSTAIDTAFKQMNVGFHGVAGTDSVIGIKNDEYHKDFSTQYGTGATQGGQHDGSLEGYLESIPARLQGYLGHLQKSIYYAPPGERETFVTSYANEIISNYRDDINKWARANPQEFRVSATYFNYIIRVMDAYQAIFTQAEQAYNQQYRDYRAAEKQWKASNRPPAPGEPPPLDPAPPPKMANWPPQGLDLSVPNIQLSYAKKNAQGVAENFADGRNPGRKGLAKRSGVNTKASVSTLRNVAKHSSGEKQRMAHWLANMKAGRAKARRK